MLSQYTPPAPPHCTSRRLRGERFTINVHLSSACTKPDHILLLQDQICRYFFSLNPMLGLNTSIYTTFKFDDTDADAENNDCIDHIQENVQKGLPIWIMKLS
jgi:hypothetical protein